VSCGGLIIGYKAVVKLSRDECVSAAVLSRQATAIPGLKLILVLLFFQSSVDGDVAIHTPKRQRLDYPVPLKFWLHFCPSHKLSRLL